MNKIAQFHKVSFEQFKESWDDSFPGASEEEIKEKARELKKTLDKYNLKAEFVAPRLWMDPHTQDGGFMSTS